MATALWVTQFRRSRALRAVRRRFRSSSRTRGDVESTVMLALICFAVLLTVSIVGWPDYVPLSTMLVPLLLGGILLNFPRLVALSTVTLVATVTAVAEMGYNALRGGLLIVVALVALILVGNARSRAQLGVTGNLGEAMLIDLRDRLASQGELPSLPREWHVEAVMRSAGGASFAGDFIVAAKTHQGRMLEVAVVDVSGKGMAAGTRALLLSGAFGGLLGSLPPEEFLPAANDYLLRQEWGEGFATVVHMALWLSTGEVEVRTAGHPPAVQFHAGSGRWQVYTSEGPVLGLLENAEFRVCKGRVLPGDAMLLYTDGVVEAPFRDITLGIDKLVGAAERLVTAGFDSGARRLIDQIESENDDRALLLLHRR